MGIKQLLPFLKKCTVPIHMKTLSGYVAAVDAYCWIHKAAICVSYELGTNNLTSEKEAKFINCVLKMVNMLLSFNIKPILVFDGENLPSKILVDTQRNKKENKRKAAEYLLAGDNKKASDYFQRSIEITSELAHKVLRAVRNIGVDCIVAPYEADAQLYYLLASGYVDVVITEDSDLLCFGAKQVIFKLDAAGYGLLITWSSGIGEHCCGMSPGQLTEQIFRYICIINGCDYFPGIPNLGLNKAAKILRQIRINDFRNLMERLSLFTKLSKASFEEIPQIELLLGDQYKRETIDKNDNVSKVCPIPQSTIDAAIRAERTFRLQVVFDPLHRKRVRISEPDHTDVTDSLDKGNFDYAGSLKKFDDKKVLQFALGNLDFHSNRNFENFYPDENYFKSVKDAIRSKCTLIDKNFGSFSGFSSKLGILQNKDISTSNRPSIRRLHLSIWNSSYPIQKVWLQYQKADNNTGLTSVVPYCLIVSPSKSEQTHSIIDMSPCNSSTPIRTKRIISEIKDQTESEHKRSKSNEQVTYEIQLPNKDTKSKISKFIFTPKTPGGNKLPIDFLTPEDKILIDYQNDPARIVDTCERVSVKLRAIKNKKPSTLFSEDEHSDSSINVLSPVNEESLMVGKELAIALFTEQSSQIGQQPMITSPILDGHSESILCIPKNVTPKRTKTNIFALAEAPISKTVLNNSHKSTKKEVHSDWSSFSDNEEEEKTGKIHIDSKECLNSSVISSSSESMKKICTTHSPKLNLYSRFSFKKTTANNFSKTKSKTYVEHKTRRNSNDSQVVIESFKALKSPENNFYSKSSHKPVDMNRKRLQHDTRESLLPALSEKQLLSNEETCLDYNEEDSLSLSFSPITHLSCKENISNLIDTSLENDSNLGFNESRKNSSPLQEIHVQSTGTDHDVVVIEDDKFTVKPIKSSKIILPKNKKPSKILPNARSKIRVALPGQTDLRSYFSKFVNPKK